MEKAPEKERAEEDEQRQEAADEKDDNVPAAEVRTASGPCRTRSRHTSCELQTESR